MGIPSGSVLRENGLERLGAELEAEAVASPMVAAAAPPPVETPGRAAPPVPGSPLSEPREPMTTGAEPLSDGPMTTFLTFWNAGRNLIVILPW